MVVSAIPGPISVICYPCSCRLHGLALQRFNWAAVNAQIQRTPVKSISLANGPANICKSANKNWSERLFYVPDTSTTRERSQWERQSVSQKNNVGRAKAHLQSLVQLLQRFSTIPSDDLHLFRWLHPQSLEPYLPKPWNFCPVVAVLVMPLHAA